MSNQQGRQVATPMRRPGAAIAYENNVAQPSGKMLIHHPFTSPTTFPGKRNGFTFTPFFFFFFL
uniref:Uncharacterized protein n=1 Tax=Setaria italica TaxID=4555 RepID=K3ZYV4_SETIT